MVLIFENSIQTFNNFIKRSPSFYLQLMLFTLRLQCIDALIQILKTDRQPVTLH